MNRNIVASIHQGDLNEAFEILKEGILSYSASLKQIFSTVLTFHYNKHLLVFFTPNIIFIRQMEKDIGRGVSRVQYLSTADQ